MEYKICKATEKDKDQVVELGRKIVDVYERTHLGDEIVNGYLESGACDNDFINMFDDITVMKIDEKIIGLISCSENCIQGFLVDIPYWGTGAAQFLLNYAITNIFKQYDTITLECFENSPRANAFYKKMGFKNSGLVDGDGGRRIIYSKDITSKN